MMNENLFFLPEIPSTNTYLIHRCMEEVLPPFYTVWAGAQTAGRGQQGNGWESEPGKNLTFTTVLPAVSFDRLPTLNMLVPLAVVRGIEAMLTDMHLTVKWPGHLSVKWPNDVYFGDKKLAGILIENVTVGSALRCSIAGVGLNVNQTTFLSPAPNPVSLQQIVGEELALEPLLAKIVAEMKTLFELPADELKRLYMASLYRREGWHLYQEREVSTAPTMPAFTAESAFEARIEDVDELGRLVLRLRDNTLRTYHFKQVRYVLC